MTDQEQLTSRMATAADKAAAWSIISRQQELMHQQGRNQWQQGYPSPEVIANDVQHLHIVVVGVDAHALASVIARLLHEQLQEA